ncbi:hypothetical protein AB0J21_05905 [Streptomyces sp. NPDC049954]|uniref:protein kinase domain-containing protein n=1 Tax=Streptomyces sp. NPDC049954 TaxID=3155779 RepID=UPI0034410F7B
MGQDPAPPAEALSLLAGRLGERVDARLLSDRRGSRTWKVTGPGGAAAVKANVPGNDGARDKAAEMVQEDDHLVRLADAGAISPGYRMGAGAWEGGRWLAVHWIDGPLLWHALAPARDADGDRSDIRARLMRITRTWSARLARLHAVDWTHADVQPTNTLVADGRAELIDYALACGPNPAAPRLPYRGALTHTTAPETAAALLGTPPDTHIQAEPPSDIWSLGASLYWCWTGQRPVIYSPEADREDMLRLIAQGRTADLAITRPWPFPEFEEIIAACLAGDPAVRPTAQSMAA